MYRMLAVMVGAAVSRTQYFHYGPYETIVLMTHNDYTVR
jgi:hypothetical protein